jgi:hypothetical protein
MPLFIDMCKRGSLGPKELKLGVQQRNIFLTFVPKFPLTKDF